jgi:hypothetical protein
MGTLVSGMWRKAAECWPRPDPSAVAAVASQDDELGDLHLGLMAELASGRVPLAAAIELTLIAPSTCTSVILPSASPGRRSTSNDSEPGRLPARRPG